MINSFVEITIKVHTTEPDPEDFVKRIRREIELLLHRKDFRVEWSVPLRTYSDGRTEIPPNFGWRNDPVEVTGMSQPYMLDPDWRETDAKGHVHGPGPDGKLPPTVKQEEVEYGPNEDGDEFSDTIYSCVNCGDVLEPRFIPDPSKPAGGMYRQLIPGPSTYLINDEEVSEEQWLAEKNKWSGTLS